MTKPKQLKRLQHARQRLRDLAAGDAGRAQAAQQAAANEHHGARRSQEGLLDDAESRFGAAAGAGDLLRYEAELVAAQGLVSLAEETWSQARVESERLRTKLMERERELRTTEKALEQMLDEIAAVERKREQSAVDDIVSTQVKRAQ